MESATQLAATLLMGLFALGVIGCAITIPICAVKFFAILFEHSEQPEVPGYRLVPVYANAEPAAAPAPADAAESKTPPSPARARAAAAGAQK